MGWDGNGIDYERDPSYVALLGGFFFFFFGLCFPCLVFFSPWLLYVYHLLSLGLRWGKEKQENRTEGW